MTKPPGIPNVARSHETASAPAADRTADYRVETWPEERFEELKLLWQRLHDSAADASVFASWEWAWNWWICLGRQPHDGACAHLLVLLCYAADGDLIGIAPFHYPAVSVLSPLPRGLRPLGVLGQRYQDLTEEPILLIKPGQEAPFLRALFQHISGSWATYGWDFVQLHILHPDPDVFPTDLLIPRRLHRRLVRQERIPVLTASLPQDWSVYRRSLSKSMRDNLPYYPRLLTRRGHVWQVRLATAPGEIQASLDRIVDLHRLRATGTRGVPHVDHLPAPEHRRLIQQAGLDFARREWIGVAVLEIGPRTVAAQSFLVRSGVLTFYYSGFDPAWYDYSPLSILQAEILAFAVTQHLPTVNFTRFDQQWKTRWGAAPTTLFQQLIVLRPSPLALVRTAVYARNRRSRDQKEDPPFSPLYCHSDAEAMVTQPSES